MYLLQKMRFNITKTFIIVIMAAGAFLTASASDNETDYKPQIHGVFRGRYEMELRDGYARFQVRNARMSAQGSVSHSVNYFVQVDFSDNGKFLFLDAYGNIALGRGWSIQAGQFRMPFGVEPFRGPNNYLFSNRSFLGKVGFNYRQVGAKLVFDTHIGTLPFTIEGGIFNSASTVNHNVWQKKYNFAGKAILKVNNTSIGVGLASKEPDSVRVNAADISIGYKIGRWAFEAEGIVKKYTHDSYKTNWSYVATANYVMPIKLGDFNALSFQGRFDGITDHSSGVRNASGKLITDNPAVNRISAGSTLSCIKGPFHADVRLNFEKYLYRDNSIPSGTDDRMLLELIIQF